MGAKVAAKNACCFYDFLMDFGVDFGVILDAFLHKKAIKIFDRFWLASGWLDPSAGEVQGDFPGTSPGRRGARFPHPAPPGRRLK